MSCEIVTVKVEPLDESELEDEQETRAAEPEPELVMIKTEPLELPEETPRNEEHYAEVSVKVEPGSWAEHAPAAAWPDSAPAAGSEPRHEVLVKVEPEMVEVYIDYANNREESAGEGPSTSGGEGGHVVPLDPSRPHACLDCGKCFRSLSNLNQHRRTHSDKEFHCAACGRGFTNRANMLRHQGRSTCRPGAPAGPYVCDVCHKVFPRAHLLRSHERRHSTARPHACDACDARFKHPSTLARHAALHTQSRPHACPQCNKRFTHLGLLKPHMRRHTGERPYQCPICLKSFSHKHNMQRHQLRHDRVKHLVCDVCHKQFPKESRLKYHMRRHATDNRPFKCERCPKSFSHRQNIQRHYRRKHPNDTYDRPETDASIAAKLWQDILQDRLCKVPDCILPE